MTTYNSIPTKHHKREVVLVVDDAPENIDILSEILSPFYIVKAALSGAKAIDIARAEPELNIILLDIEMPQMTGYEVCEVLKKDEATKKIPIIFVTARDSIEDEEKGFKLGAVDYIKKPISPPIVKARIQTQLLLSNQNRYLEEKVIERTLQLVDSRREIIRRLGRAAEFRDNETGMHVIRMSHYSRIIASFVSNDEHWLDLLFHAAPMHDVGKIGIPDGILLKPDKLAPNEWKVMQKHSEYGAQIIGDQNCDILKMAKEIAQTHHEKWDGSGYPEGLKGQYIPITGRIVAIADVFDALTSVRPYKNAWPLEKAIQYINDNTGQHFEPQLVEIFHKALPEILHIKERYAEDKADKLTR